MLEAALVLVLAVQAARLLWAVLAPVGPLASPAPVGLPAQLPALSALDPFFGGAAGNAVPAADLQGWRLFGVRSDAAGGSAILARDQSAQAAYRPGDELAPGLVLDSVHAGHVLVRSAGATLRLDLPTPATSPAGASPAAASAPASTLPTASAGTADVDPAQLLARSALKQLDEGGRSAGYTLMPQADGPLLRQAGLRPGDVLLRVNGQPLAPGTFAELADELKRNPSATIEFEREGQTHTVTLGSGTP